MWTVGRLPLHHGGTPSFARWGDKEHFCLYKMAGGWESHMILFLCNNECEKTTQSVEKSLSIREVLWKNHNKVMIFTGTKVYFR